MSENIILKNLRLFYLNRENELCETHNDIFITDGKYSQSKEQGIEYKEYDMGGRVAYTGLVNFHHHIYSQLSKGMPVSGDLSNFYNILKNMWWKLDKVLFDEAVEFSAHLAAIDCLKNGVSTVFDHHASFDFIEGSLKKISDILSSYGLNNVMCFECSDRNGEEVFKRSVMENLSFLEYSKTKKNIDALFGLHAPFTLNDNSLHFIKDSVPVDCGYHFHLAEDILDPISSWEKNGIDIVERIMNYDLVNGKTILGHCNHLTPEQLSILAEREPAIAHNPASNMNNAVGLFNFSKLKDIDKIKFLPGTDGMTANILSSIKTAFLIYRHENRSSEIGFELVQRMLKDSFWFMRKFFHEYSSFENGNIANITVFDYIPYCELNTENFLGHFIYGITESGAYSLINERMLMHEKSIIGVNEKEICEQGLKVSRKLWERL